MRRDWASPASARATGCAQERLGIDAVVAAEEVTVTDDYIGPGYGEPTPEGLEAMRLAAEMEGLVLDPVYTGKCLAGLIGGVRRGEIRRDETVVFWHTGGAPELFAHAREFSLDEDGSLRLEG